MSIDANYATALTHPTPVSIGAEGLSKRMACGGSDPTHLDDVWYKFVAPNNGQKVVIRTTATSASNPWVVGIYDHCGGNAVTCNTSNDPLNYQTILSLCPYQYTPNQTYYIRMYPYDYRSSTTTGVIIYNDPAVCPAIPRNDSFATAIRFSRTQTVMGTTFLANDERAGLPSCEDGTKSIYDVWYKFSTGTGAGRMMSANLILYNTSSRYFKMTVYKAPCTPSNELTLTSNNSFCQSIGSDRGGIPIWGMEENQDYYVRVWSNTVATQGSFNLSFENVVLYNSTIAGTVFSGNDCSETSTAKIDSTNNNRWVPIRYGWGIDVIAEIKANGQNLGIVEGLVHADNDTLRRSGNDAFLPRNLFLSAQYPPTAPIQLRFYVRTEEWDSLKTFYPTLSDTAFRVVKMVGAPGCKWDADTVGFAQTRMTDATLKKLN